MARDTTHDSERDTARTEATATPDAPHDTTGDSGAAPASAAAYVVTITDAHRITGESVRTIQRRLDLKPGDARRLEPVERAGKRWVKLPASEIPEGFPADELAEMAIEADAVAVVSVGDVSGDTTGDTLNATHSTLALGASHDRQGAMLALVADVAGQAAARAVLEYGAQVGADRPAVDIANKLVLTLDECRALTGFSRATLRAAIDTGELKATRIGRGFKVTRRNLNVWIDSL